VKRRKCKHCGRSFVINSRRPDQKYCAQKECQRARKNDWQRQKLASDEDYRCNQSACRTNWLKHNTGYWKQYRKNHPEYAQRNREKQRERNLNRRRSSDRPIASSVAKMDAKNRQKVLISGYYKLIPVSDIPFANMEPIIVRIHETAYPAHPL
jgi:hypothetical protein